MRLYPRLALSALRRNGRLYVPYLLSCVGMTALFYIIRLLSLSPLLGANTTMIISMGTVVIAFFSLLFLGYTNAFLVRSRYREFGLYNVLGMDRRGIGRVIAWESVLTALIGTAGGLVLGVALGKLAELGLMRAVGLEPTFDFTLPGEAVAWTAELFLAIHLLLLILSLLRIRRSRPLELMRSEAQGEKPPRANWLVALLGALLLAAGYFIAVHFKSPLQALLLFLIAVLLVILATYLLFSAGSVTLCRALQRNKAYYYKKAHFISVSSMAFRMKRNGAGLASVCILATMVLVMISSSSSLYFGLEDIVRVHCPMDANIELIVPDAAALTPENTRRAGEILDAVLDERGAAPREKRLFAYVSSAGLLHSGRVQLDPDVTEGLSEMMRFGDLWQFVFLRAEEYNAVMGTALAPAPGEAYIGTAHGFFPDNEIDFGPVRFTIAGRTAKTVSLQSVDFNASPAMMLVVSDFDQIAPLTAMTGGRGDPLVSCCVYYGWDMDAPDGEIVELYSAQTDAVASVDFFREPDGTSSYRSDCRQLQRETTRNLFGGLFFLGILLSVAFILATVLILYYKQIAEGYEDQSRFAIMRKVGMTDRDIRQSINAQMLTVFFAPLIAAGVHLCFAFPMIWRMLQLFALQNLRLTLLMTAAAFVLFAVFYTIVYRLTTRGYYRIVSGAMGREQEALT